MICIAMCSHRTFVPPGEVLEMTHVARGLDKDGTLQFDVLLKGDIPEISPVSDIVLLPYVEDYIQTGPGKYCVV